MKTIFTLLLFFVVVKRGSSQLLLNELYTDPGAGKHEFFELYNTNPSTTPFSVDNATLITYFNISGTKGFYVMDLPNMTVASRGYFVGAAALPFNYQGTTNSNAADFNWNSISFPLNNGYIKKWVLGTANLLDGNANYDQAIIPANFNDFFYRITGTGASYSVFLYNNGTLINSFIGGTGGQTTVTSEIVNMPPLFVDMSGSSPDFTINFSGYGSLPVEDCISDAGSDNGYIRQYDGACASWKKSSSSAQHTPRASNGTLIGAAQGSVSVAVSTWQGNSTTGSIVYNDIVSAPSSYFPIDLQIFTDLGSTWGKLDPSDVYVTTNTESVVSQGPFYTHFTPFDANILIAVKTNAGCFDKILFVPNAIILSAKMLSFTGRQIVNETKMNWEVEANENLDHFELQRSTDGVNYATIAVILASENSGRQSYEYNDPVNGDHAVSYRLRIFNKGGKVDYSNTIYFGTKEKLVNGVQILSNPVTDKLSFNYNAAGESMISARIIDMSGNIVMQQNLKAYKGKTSASMNLPSSMHGGTYLLNITEGNSTVSNKFVKQ